MFRRCKSRERIEVVSTRFVQLDMKKVRNALRYRKKNVSLQKIR